MKTLILTCVAVAVLAGCNAEDNRIRFDGEIFRGKSAKVKEDPRQFTVSVSPVSASLDGAREAGRYEGIKYCIAAYGTSDIEWSVGPDTDPGELIIDRDTLAFAGTCIR